MQHVRSATGSHGVTGNQGTPPSFNDVVGRLQMSSWPLLVASIADFHALERLTEALIGELSSKADVTDWQACCVLHTLYAKLFKERATTRFVAYPITVATICDFSLALVLFHVVLRSGSQDLQTSVVHSGYSYLLA
jgi:hypothetical protein